MNDQTIKTMAAIFAIAALELLSSSARAGQKPVCSMSHVILRGDSGDKIIEHENYDSFPFRSGDSSVYGNELHFRNPRYSCDSEVSRCTEKNYKDQISNHVLGKFDAVVRELGKAIDEGKCAPVPNAYCVATSWKDTRGQEVLGIYLSKTPYPGKSKRNEPNQKQQRVDMDVNAGEHVSNSGISSDTISFSMTTREAARQIKALAATGYCQEGLIERQPDGSEWNFVSLPRDGRQPDSVKDPKQSNRQKVNKGDVSPKQAQDDKSSKGQQGSRQAH